MNDSIQIGKKTLRNIAIVIVCVALLLTTYFVANRYVAEEVQIRDEKVSDLTKQVSTLHEYLNANSSQLIDLSSQVSNLTDRVNALTSENEYLTNLTDAKQQQLYSAWSSLSGLRGQVAELQRIIALYQAPPTPTFIK